MTAPSRRVLRPRSILILTSVLGFLVPAVADLCSPSWQRRAFGWVAGDAFYYLTVARSVVRHGRVAYDQTHRNNGFHPMWQAACAGLAGVTDWLHAGECLVLVAVLTGVVFISAAIVLFGWGLAGRGHTLSVFFPLLPIGAYALLILPVWARGMATMDLQNPYEGPMPLYGTLWSHANGMESCLVVFFLALAAWIFSRADVRSDRRSASGFGLALAGLGLSRLDHLLVVLPLAVAAALSLVATRQWRGPLSCLLGTLSLPIALYVVLNHHFFGTWVPVSGALKTSLPYVNDDNITQVIAFWTSPWAGAFLDNAYRHLAAEVPPVVALLYLAIVLELRLGTGSVVVRLRGWTGRHHAFLALMAPGVILLALYDILFVAWIGQGHWYFPVSTLFVSLAALSLSAPLEARVVGWLRPWLGRFGSGASRASWCAWLGASAACVVAFFMIFQRQLGYHRNYADFYLLEAPKVRAHYAGETPRFLEGDDGIIAYSLSAPTMSTGFGLDPAGAAALLRGELLELALERGHDRLTSLVYTRGDSLAEQPSALDLRRWARSLVPFAESKAYAFTLDYRSADGHFAIVRARKD